MASGAIWAGERQEQAGVAAGNERVQKDTNALTKEKILVIRMHTYGEDQVKLKLVHNYH